MRITFRLALAGLLTTFACVATPALAQTQDDGLPRTLPGLRGTTDGRQIVNLSISSVETYDSNVRAETNGVSPTLFQASGFYTGFTPVLDFRLRRGTRVEFTAAAGSNLRYYGDLHRAAVVNHYGSAGFSVKLGRGTVLRVDQAAAYSPSYLSGLFAKVATQAPGDLVAPGTDFAASSERSYTYATNVALTQRTTSRGTLSLNSGFRRTVFVHPTPGSSDFLSYDVGARYGQRLSRNTGLQLGYTYRQARYSLGRQPVEHDITLGFDYQVPFSRSRSTTLNFNVGSSVFEGQAPLDSKGLVQQSVDPRSRRYQVLGDASLTHQIGRTWSLRGGYRRGMGFIDGLSDPVSIKATTVSADGSLSRWSDVLVSAAYSTGDLAFARNTSSFSTYTGDARVRFAVARMWATYVEYLYYFYDFSNSGIQLPPGFSPRLRRSSVRFGLMLRVSARRK